MKKSKSVTLLFLPALAAAALAYGCGSEAVSRTCVDNDQNIVPLSNCENEREQHPGGSFNYHWYYFRGNYAPSTGHASGGSFFAPEGSSFAPDGSVGSVSRGGFGAIGSGHASGGQ